MSGGNIRYYLPNNVFEESLNRIRDLFDEFDNVIVAHSGGKDSTVTLNLALQVAEEKGRLPLKVTFIDQEAEWYAVVEHLREIFADERIEPYWIQCPFRIYNATSNTDTYITAWGEGEEWIRPQEPNSYKENIYGTDDFYQLFNEVVDWIHKGERGILLGGVRSEESPRRALAMVASEVHNTGRTWGKVLNKKKEQYTFYPIYDWSYKDVWKSIQDNNWSYCKVYDWQYSHGVGLRNMRVSNLHHETAISTLEYLQEFEHKTWEALTKRLKGINSFNHLGSAAYYNLKKLPFMFRDWKEYCYYLLDNLITEPKFHKDLSRKFELIENKFALFPAQDEIYIAFVKTIVCNDVEGTKLRNWTENPQRRTWSRYMDGKWDKSMIGSKYIPQEDIYEKIKEYEARDKESV